MNYNGAPRRQPSVAVKVLAFLAATTGTAFASELAIEHGEVSCILAGRHPQLAACVRPSEDLAKSRILFRASGTEQWFSVDMGADMGCYTALLPKPLPSLKAIDYYVHAIARDFAEAIQPMEAPSKHYQARVVDRELDCDPLKVIATSVAAVATPIVLTGGKGVAPVGFSRDGIVQTQSPSSSGGNGGGPSRALLVVGGLAVAAGVGVGVASGGDDSTPPVDGSSASAPDVIGRWVGGFQVAFDATPNGGPRGTSDVQWELNLVQAGSGVTGTSRTAFTTPVAQVCSGTVSGSFVGSTVSLTVVDPPSCIPNEWRTTGTVTGNVMTGSFPNSTFSFGGSTFTYGNWTLRR